MNPVLTALRLAPSLTIRGRASGRKYTMPVLPLDYEGRRYLVAPRGNTHWARNLRAVGEGDLRLRGRTIHFKATEIPAAQRGPIVAAYVEQHGKLLAQVDPPERGDLSDAQRRTLALALSGLLHLSGVQQVGDTSCEDAELTWQRWVDAWERDQAGKEIEETACAARLWNALVNDF